MEVGDTFTVIVLGEEHLYVVDQIKTVLPDDLSDLEIDPEKDFVTLITCTPYGVNTHRLMVRGVRVPEEEEEQIIENAMSNDVKWFDFTREQIVNMIAGGMAAIFGLVLIPIMIFPAVPKRIVALRPWDDNIEKVIASAIIVAENATRANWETENFTKESEWLAALRRWDDTLKNRVPFSEMDESRPWNDYDYVDDTDAKAPEEEQEKYREWDDDILEKVAQDWSPFDRNYNRYMVKFTEIEDVMERGGTEPPPEDLQKYFDLEKAKGDKIIELLKRLEKRK